MWRNRIIIIACALFMVVIISIIVIKQVEQFRWTTKLNAAIYNENEVEIDKLLSNSKMDVNKIGRNPAYYGIRRPLYEACIVSNYEMVEKLISRGAEVYSCDVFVLLGYENLDDYRIVKLFVEKGYKPEVCSDEGENLLLIIAGYDPTYADCIFGIAREKWEIQITKTYELIYENAEPFDRLDNLLQSLKIAEAVGNETLVAYINSKIKEIEIKVP